jgi:hypothetical protein
VMIGHCAKLPKCGCVGNILANAWRGHSENFLVAGVKRTGQRGKGGRDAVVKNGLAFLAGPARA